MLKKKFYSKAVIDREPEIASVTEIYAEKLLEYQEKYAALDIYNSSLNVLIIAQIFLKYFSHVKEEYGFLDFNDIISKTLNLLESSQEKDWILYKLNNDFEHLLLDEAQDTNPMHWEIIHHLFSEYFASGNESLFKKTLFIVGDEKQSIYSSLKLLFFLPLQSLQLHFLYHLILHYMLLLKFVH